MEEDINLLEWVVTNKLYIDTHNECDYHHIHKAIKNILRDYKQKLEAIDEEDKLLKWCANQIERLQQENEELRRGQQALMKNKI